MVPNRMIPFLGLGLALTLAGCASVPPGAGVPQGARGASDAESASGAGRRSGEGRANRVPPAGTAAGQYALGRIELASGRHEAALQRFRDALALDPGHVEALNGIGVVYGETGRLADSIGAFQQALVLAPDAPHVLGNLGVAQLRGGRLDDAWRSVSRAFELDPSNVRTRENVRSVLEARGAARTPPVALNDTATSVLQVTPVMRFGHTGPPEPAAVTPGSPGTPPDGGVTPTVAPTAPPTGAVPSRSTTVLPPAVAESSPAASPPTPATSPAGSFLVVENPPDGLGLVAVAPNVYELRVRGGTPRVDERRAGGVAPAGQSVGVPKAAAVVHGPARVRLEISNGVGEARLAARTALEVARIGYADARLSDARPFGLAASHIEFRPGFVVQARALADAMGVAVPLVARDDLRPIVDLRLVLGRDLASWERTARGVAPVLVGAPRTSVAPATPRPAQRGPRVI